MLLNITKDKMNIKNETLHGAVNTASASRILSDSQDRTVDDQGIFMTNLPDIGGLD